MLNQLSNVARAPWAKLAGALLVALALLFLINNQAFAHDPVPDEHDVADHIHYDENGEGPVRTFTSTDPEGAGIDWDVTGIDADDFAIDSRGVLTFNSPPNYEIPTDRARAAVDLNGDGNDDPGDSAAVPGMDREYEITVRATEKTTSGDDHRALSTESHVTVVVDDVDESGSVTLNRLQPEVGTAIMASLRDPDADEPDIEGTFDADVDTGVALVTLGWQWYVSKVTNPIANAENHWVLATGEGATTVTYTPFGDCVNGKVDPTNTAGSCPYTDQTDPNAEVDEGKYLRAVVMYTDLADGETATRDDVREAIMVSDYPVRAEVSSDSDGVENPENGSPGFSSAGDYKRSVPEDTGSGMSVGAPVVAIDPDDDTLTYELDDDRDADVVGTTGDVGFFSIDRATGQVMVKNTLSYEATDGRNYDPENGETADVAGTYKFYVRAIDPSGETAEIAVTVNVTDANDAPQIMSSVESTGTPADPMFAGRTAPPSELRVNEDTGSYDGEPGMPIRSIPGGMNVFTADDEDARGQIFWDIKGEDVDDFELTSSSPDPFTGLRGPGEPIALKFKNDPDYENPTDENRDSVYKVTIVARDRFTGGLTDERPLTIFVDNVEEDGKVTLSTDEPFIGEAVTASVVDPDNGVAIVTWRWERSRTGVDGTWTVINDATTGAYTPVTVDDGRYLQATVTYTDIMSNSDDPSTIFVDERTQKSDGEDPPRPVARDPDPELEGGPDKLYRVKVISKNAVRVEPGGTTDREAPQFSAPSYDRTVAENAETDSIVGDAVRVNSEKDITFTYDLKATVTGDDDYFDIDEDSGQIRVGEVLFPAPLPAGVMDPAAVAPAMTDPTLDYEGDNTFTLIVSATDDKNGARKAIAEVNITLVNLNERPYFDKVSRVTVENTVMYSEHRTNAVISQLAAFDPDGGDLRWEVTGADASDFVIVDVEDIGDGKDRVQLRFKSQPDFEKPKDAAGDTNRDGDIEGDNEGAGDNYYHVTVRATEVTAIGGGPAMAAELVVTVQVENYNEPGSVELTWLQPEVGTPITAIVTDPDGPLGDSPAITPIWQWYQSKVSNPNRNPDPTKLSAEWEMIEVSDSGNDTLTYTPQGKTAGTTETAVDEGRYLLVTASYDDGASENAEETNRVAIGISANTVRADVSDTDNNSPDFNQSETTREIPEDTAVGMPVGDAVDVDRNEDSDVLTYEIVTETTGDDGNASVVPDDHSYFSIDKATGQLRVAKNLSAEETDGRDHDAVDDAGVRLLTAGEYTIVVRATDPSGEGLDENRDDIVVTITATNVDEAPGVTDGMAELSVNEVNSTNKNFYVGLGYVLTPGDGGDPATVDLAVGNPNLYHRTEEDILDRAFWPEPIAGPDGHLFEYSTPDNGIGRRIHFIDPPSYEDPQDANRDNVYEVTIRVVDGDGLVGEKSVRVTVMNVNEDGKLTLSPEQPDDGMPVIATITDPDSPAEYGGVVVTNWEWATAASSTVTEFPADPADEDVSIAEIAEGESMSEYTGKAGQFLLARVSYRDGFSEVDDPVTALDERNDDPAETPEGIQTDFDSDIMVSASTANAVQPDPDPTPEGTTPDTGVVEMEMSVYENTPSTGYVGMPIAGLGTRDTIGGPDGDTFVFAEANDSDGDPDPLSTYYDALLQGPAGGTEDAPVDDVDDKGGQLALAPVTHLDADGSKTTYVIEVSDPGAAVELSVFRITITVMDVNEAPSAPSELKGLPPVLNTAPEFGAETTERSVAENTDAGENIGAPVMATDADEDELTYTLGGADAASFDIDAATGQLMTKDALDYETQDSYEVTVTASDEDGLEATVTVTVNVTDVGLGGYDANESGDISRDEVLAGIRDFLFPPDPANPVITRDGVLALIGLYLRR